ncbi:MAG: tail fiber domain-containing protein [Cytophagales bacterium]|nr:tail fiber domain-containing protein [Cytophagales bacterium]
MQVSHNQLITPPPTHYYILIKGKLFTINKLFIILCMYTTSLHTYSQIRVLSNGNMGVGTTNPGAKTEIWGTTGQLGLRLSYGNFSMGGNAEFKMDFPGLVGGKFSILNNGNVGICTASPQTPLHIYYPGNNLVRVQSTYGGLGNSANLEFSTYAGTGVAGRIAGVDEGSYTGSLKFYTNNSTGVPNSTANYETLRLYGPFAQFNAYVFSYGNQLFSDKCLKSNIKTCIKASEKILAMNGVTYTPIDSMEIDDYTPISVPTQAVTDTSVKLQVNVNDDTYAKPTHNKIKKKVPYGKAMNSTTQYGLIAQEVEKIVPELVTTTPGGMKAVNYTGVIPILIEAFKEQNAKIETLQAEILKLKGKKASSARVDEGAKQAEATSTTGAYLYQNTPNPFNKTTEIKYYIAESVQDAFITITDLGGKQIKTLPITTKGESYVTIKANELYAGLFAYTLVADGHIIDTKRMVIIE